MTEGIRYILNILIFQSQECEDYEDEYKDCTSKLYFFFFFGMLSYIISSYTFSYIKVNINNVKMLIGSKCSALLTKDWKKYKSKKV